MQCPDQQRQVWLILYHSNYLGCHFQGTVHLGALLLKVLPLTAHISLAFDLSKCNSSYLSRLNSICLFSAQNCQLICILLHLLITNLTIDNSTNIHFLCKLANCTTYLIINIININCKKYRGHSHYLSRISVHL